MSPCCNPLSSPVLFSVRFRETLTTWKRSESLFPWWQKTPHTGLILTALWVKTAFRMVPESVWSPLILTATDATGTHHILWLPLLPTYFFLKYVNFPYSFLSGYAAFLTSEFSVWGGRSWTFHFRREEDKISTPFRVSWIQASFLRCHLSTAFIYL